MKLTYQKTTIYNGVKPMKNNVLKFPNQATRRKPLNASAVIHEKPEKVTAPRSKNIFVNLYFALVAFNLVFWPLLFFIGD